MLPKNVLIHKTVQFNSVSFSAFISQTKSAITTNINTPPVEYSFFTKWKRTMCVSNYIQTTFFYLYRRFQKKLADGQCSEITKEIVYHIKYRYVHTIFASGVTWNRMFGSIYLIQILTENHTQGVFILDVVTDLNNFV